MSPRIVQHQKKAGFVDFFINSLRWGIELSRDPLKMKTHYERFLSGGAYEHLNLKQWAVIDIRIGDLVTFKDKSGRENLCHAVYSKDLQSVTIKWGGSPDYEQFNLTGDKIAHAASFTMDKGEDRKVETTRKRGVSEDDEELPSKKDVKRKKTDATIGSPLVEIKCKCFKNTKCKCPENCMCKGCKCKIGKRCK